MEKIKFKEFVQKLAELKKSEVEKVDEIFSPQVKAAANKNNAALALFRFAEKQAKFENRPLSNEEIELKEKSNATSKAYKEIYEQWRKAQYEARNKAEEIIFEMYTKDTETIINLLKQDIPIQITLIAITTIDLSFYDEYKNFIHKNDTNFRKKQSEAEQFLFNDNALRERLQEIFQRFLDVLEKNDKKGFKTAWKLINESIKNKSKILNNIREQMSTVFEDNSNFDNKTKTNNKLIKINTHLAKEIVSGTTKLEQVIFDPRKNPIFYDPEIKDIDINVGNQGKKTITTIASIDFNNMKEMGVSITHEKWITPFDREILSIVSSLYVAGNEYQSPQMIFQAMSGNKEKVKLTPEIRAKIIESLEKLRYTKIEINSSQEEKVGWNKSEHYDGALLPSEHIEIMMLNGQEVIDCTHMFRNSPLYDYAEGKNQISRVNIEMLQAPVNSTTENIELKFYLLRLISSMKNSKSKIKHVIRYDTLYEYLGIDENESDIQHRKKDIRDRVKKILNFWVKKGFILGFEEEKEGVKIAKIKISL